MKKFLTILFVPILIIIGIGYLLPEFKEMPCGTASSYNHQSFWHWPWTRGTSGHPHTGVDIFGKIGTTVRAQNGGLVIYSAYMNDTAGNAVFVLGPKWRVHMYLHLKERYVETGDFLACGCQIGTLGNTGNAKKTPPHVHYGFFTPIPYVWKFFIPIGEDNQPVRYNWMKMFWLNPADHLPTE